VSAAWLTAAPSSPRAYGGVVPSLQQMRSTTVAASSSSAAVAGS
jgi:hypothetical protein